jgi:hypothetical protein
MRTRLLAAGPERTFALVCAAGDDAIASLKRFARTEALAASRITGIGAFSSALLGYFELARKDYRRIPIDGQVEVLSLIGDITLAPDGSHQVHAHVVLGAADGSTRGGHLLGATVDPTLELIITESPAHLRRRTDAATGLALIDLEQA